MLPGLVDIDDVISSQWRTQLLLLRNSFYIHNVYESNNIRHHKSQIWPGSSHKLLLGKSLKSRYFISPFAKCQKVALCLINSGKKYIPLKGGFYNIWLSVISILSLYVTGISL